MSWTYFLLLATTLTVGLCHGPGESPRFNVGWNRFLDDEPTEFHNLPLWWERDTPVPAWLRGSYIKNGPSQKRFGTEDRWYAQYMDSWAKLNKITFNGDGVVLYSGRMIETKNYKRCAEAGKIVPHVTVGKLAPEDWSVIEMTQGFMQGYDNTNVIFWRLGPEDPANASYVASTDAPLVHIMDPESLGVLEEHMPIPPFYWGGISMMSSSHWRRELGTDNSINYHQEVGLHGLDFVLYRYRNSVFDREEIGRFAADFVSFIHMISVTPNYAVVVMYPVTMNATAMPEHNMHPVETIQQVDSPTKIYLIDLKDGTVLDGFATEDPSMVFATHIMNSWEEGEDEVVFDLSTNPWSSMRDAADLWTMMNHPETDREDSDSVMKRVRMRKSTREVVVEEWPISEDQLRQGKKWLNTVDFPVINENYLGYKNRYAYGWIGVDYWRQTLLKKDLEDTDNYIKWFKESHYPGEMFFIPNPEGEAEDDGVLITIVFDGFREQSYVMLLDGQTFEEINIAYLPYNVPFSFHGNWFPELY